MVIEQTIKQRLIGAVVLVALAVIFLPGILGQKKTNDSVFESKIPPRAVQSNELKKESEKQVKITDKTDNTIVASADDKKTPDKVADESAQNSHLDNSPTAIADVSSSDSKVLETSNVKQNNTPIDTMMFESWIIQLGSFSSTNNAKVLVDDLIGKSYKAFLRPVTLDNQKVMFRVFVGPFFDKPTAEQTAQKLAKEFSLNPIVSVWDASKE